MSFSLRDTASGQRDMYRLTQNPLRPLGREGTPVVPPRLTLTKQKSLCDATGREKPASLFSGTLTDLLVTELYPCSITGAPELGYLPVGVRPFNSEVHSASALLPGSHPAVIPDRVPGSLEIALKRTRPRQRFWILLGKIV